MATKNIVPNADGEGQLGTSSKSWAQGHIDSITGTIATAAQGSITSLGTLTSLAVSGGDVQISKSSTPTLRFTQTSATEYNAYIKLGGNDLEIRGSSGIMEFYNGGNNDGNSATLALSISSSQNATFAGTVTSNGQLKTGTATTVTPVSVADDFIIDPGVASVGMSIIGTGQCAIQFGDADDADVGEITYVHGSENDMIFTVNATNPLKIKSDGNVEVSDGDLVIGTAGHGINFSATSDGSGMSAEVFDDYEEGSWTPRVTDGTDVAQSNGSFTRGDYTKIGRLVHCSFQIVLTDLTSSGGGEVNGSIRMDGFPFANRNVQGAQSGGVIGAASHLNITAGHSVSLVMRINVAEADFSLSDSSGGTTDMQASEFSDDGQCKGTISYMTDS